MINVHVLSNYFKCFSTSLHRRQAVVQSAFASFVSLLTVLLNRSNKVCHLTLVSSLSGAWRQRDSNDSEDAGASGSSNEDCDDTRLPWERQRSYFVHLERYGRSRSRVMMWIDPLWNRYLHSCVLTRWREQMHVSYSHGKASSSQCYLQYGLNNK